MQYLRSLPGWENAANQVRTNPQLTRDLPPSPAGVDPENTIGFVNEVKKVMGREAGHSVTRMDRAPNPQEARGWTMDEAAVRDTALRASAAQMPPAMMVAPYDAALGIETAMRNRVLAPLERGPLGQLAKTDLEIGKAVEVLFPREPTKIHGQAAVGDAVARIAARSPKLAEDAVRAHLEIAFNNIGRDVQSGASQARGANLRKDIFGSQQQRENMRAAIEALPNGAERWQGFNRLMEVFEAQGKRPPIGSRTAYNTEGLKDFGGEGSLVRDLTRIGANPMSGAQPFIDRYNQWKLGKNLDDVAAIMTNPRSAELLRQIAASPRGGTREGNVVRALMFSQAFDKSKAGADAQK
jgi:hypothetical protein